MVLVGGLGRHKNTCQKSKEIFLFFFANAHAHTPLITCLVISFIVLGDNRAYRYNKEYTTFFTLTKEFYTTWTIIKEADDDTCYSTMLSCVLFPLSIQSHYIRLSLYKFHFERKGVSFCGRLSLIFRSDNIMQ